MPITRRHPRDVGPWYAVSGATENLPLMSHTPPAPPPVTSRDGYAASGSCLVHWEHWATCYLAAFQSDPKAAVPQDDLQAGLMNWQPV